MNPSKGIPVPWKEAFNKIKRIAVLKNWVTKTKFFFSFATSDLEWNPTMSTILSIDFLKTTFVKSTNKVIDNDIKIFQISVKNSHKQTLYCPWGVSNLLSKVVMNPFESIYELQKQFNAPVLWDEDFSK